MKSSVDQRSRGAFIARTGTRALLLAAGALILASACGSEQDNTTSGTGLDGASNNNNFDAGSPTGSDGAASDTADGAATDGAAVMCTANATRCTGPATLEACSAAGNELRTFSCSNGCGATDGGLAVCQPIRLDLGWSVYQFNLTDDSITTPAAYTFEQGGLVATQIANPMASAYIKDEVLDRIKVTGRFTVNTGADDDLVGFVFGWQDPQHFYLFDWKQAAQADATCGTSEAGAVLKVVSSDTAIDKCADLWASTGTAKVKPLSTVAANPTGWEDFKPYDFTLDWRPGDIRITVKSGNTTVVSITSNDASYARGKFGFYDYSQEQVRFEFFTIAPAP